MFFKDENPDGYRLKHITGRLRGNKRVVIFEFENRQKLTIAQLPAGYRRLISIVFDIAVRSVILNGLNTYITGTVLIDEIDLHLHLHLHPSLEQNVIDRFKRIFPNIQFIITTHSPLVISNFKQDENNKIIVMKKEDGQYSNSELTDIYGIGYDITVSQIMQTPARNSSIEYLTGTYIRFKRRNKNEEAEIVLQKLKEEAGRLFEKIYEEITQRLKEE